ncbi:MAG: Trk system potassium transporter TrkA [Psychroflexus sp.]|jgi:trk system potassium uptake protein TrkA|nr:Trk system potassium transporter TrkA [Psychroflexus sp.]MDR9447738.1 Trk system potassium transporter TrkA [Psychroflexus sp.]
MKILIAGAGEVGYHLSKLLSYESHDITLIETDKERLSYADTHLDIKTVNGDATSFSVLKEALIEDTDMLIAVTSSQSANISICAIGKQMGAKQTIARVSNQEYVELPDLINFKEIGVDDIISPEWLASEEVKLLLNQSAFTDTYEFDDGALTMIGLTLSDEAPFVKKTVQQAAEFYPGLHFIPIALQRHETQYTIIPRGSTVFKAKDRIYFITDQKGVEELYKLAGETKQAIKRVMILGGSNIGRQLAEELTEQNYKVKLIEKNYEKALDIADTLTKTLVIHGDGRNVGTLEEESITEMDAFIAVTEDSETNIMASLVAKTKNVRKTIALVENMDYFKLSHSIGINSLINKKLIAANKIFRYVRKGNVIAITKLNNMNAELLEFVVGDNAKICNERIVDIDIPRGAVIGGVIRDKKGIIALGDFKLKAGDRLVMCCLPKAIKKAEKLFSK